MYAESLITPNPIRYPDAATEPLTAACGLDEAREYIESAPDRTEATLSVISHIEERVGKSLHFSSDAATYRANGAPATVLESMRHSQITSCIGYTMVGSECLDIAGIEHYVAYVNTHFMLLAPLQTSEGLRIRSVDMLSPYLDHDITEAVLTAGPDEIASRLAADPTHSFPVMLSTTTYAAHAGTNIETLSHDEPWLASYRRNALGPSYTDDLGRYERLFSGVMNIYTAAAGREVIEQYASFQRAVTISDIDLAVSSLRGLRARYPEIDCRAPHSEIRSLVGKLCLSPDRKSEATSVIDDYCDGMRTVDARAAELRADLLRRIAELTADADAAEAASVCYDDASKQTSPSLRNIRTTYRRKRDKMAAMAAQLRNTGPVIA